MRLIGAASASLAAQEKPAFWHMTTLYAFTGNADGAVPYGGVVLDPAGNVYGTTTNGGNFGGGYCGTPGQAITCAAGLHGSCHPFSCSSEAYTKPFPVCS